MITRKYNLINNLCGWGVFLIALCTYWLTLEPTASYWDCGEFIIQADKLEIGHPPGNPIFMLTARFFANFASSQETVSVMVNAMSGLLSALTILLLFWTVTHLVRRLVVRDGQTAEPSLQQYLIIMGSGIVGALAYTWSDTFWFSAVEGEVYAFSSFCTALVFWLILKWENRADDPGADRYLVLIAYIIGISVAVHLLNLLCIPAIVLVYAYRRFKKMDVGKSLFALVISFAIIFFVLYGLVPGFIKVAQQFELTFVNGFGMSFNSGTLIYAIVTVAMFVATLAAFYRQSAPLAMRLLFLVSVTLSGMLFIGSGVWIGLLLTVGLAVLLFVFWDGKKRALPVRELNLVMWSIAVIFVGYSSYALILIRSTADTPMNQNAPDNVFDLASYLNREQYGETPLLYGPTINSGQMKELVGEAVDTLGQDEQGNVYTLSTPYYDPIVGKGAAQYAKGVRGAQPDDSDGLLTEEDKASNEKLSKAYEDYYVKKGYKADYKMNPELDMLFPRIHSVMHKSLSGEWVNMDTMPDNMKEIHAIDKETGEKVLELDTRQQPFVNDMGIPTYPVKTAYRPTYEQNFSYFFNYQLNHMYMRYFMWNFAGRQNDLLNQHGELDLGNWISGIPFIDNPRLGDQSYLPDDLGKNNKGHNVYYMLPLLLGIIGLLWQAFAGKRGIEQFWVVFFLFFMTGIAIVLYLNQPPGQPRERDYAFAGSFYAFAIWIGMGVAGLWRILVWARKNADKKSAANKPQHAARGEEPEQLPSLVDEPKGDWKTSAVCAAVACVLGICIPLQMVSQTWDDHDRSGRYAARDFGANYLESLEPNAIIFCNGDNDTFPLWYAQEVEGVRPDVKIINLSYLNSEWYADQQRMQSYTAPPVKYTARPQDYAYGRMDATFALGDGEPMPVLDALRRAYAGEGREKYGYPLINARYLYIPVDKEAVIKRGLVAPQDTAAIQDAILIDLANAQNVKSKGYASLGEMLMLDIIATNAANGWERPIYWACTVGPEYHLNMTPYLRSTGMAHQLVPTIQEDMAPRADRAYDVVTKKYRWGGADADPATSRIPYFDETAGRMLTTMRGSMLDLAQELIYQGDVKRKDNDTASAAAEYKKALGVMQLMDSRLRDTTMPFGLSNSITRAQLYCELGVSDRLNNKSLTQKGLEQLKGIMTNYSQYVKYNQYVSSMFINPSLSLESSLIPYQYYHLIELYDKYSGGKSIEAYVKSLGIDVEAMRKNYEKYLNRDSASAGGSDIDLVAELLKYAEVVNVMASYSPSEYADATAEEKSIDSMFYDLVDYLRASGEDMKRVEENEQFKRVDMNRSKRLSDEYRRNHPDMTENAEKK